MKVKILPQPVKVHDGVSRYILSLACRLRSLGVEIVEDSSYDVLHLTAAHQYAPEWREAKALGKKVVVTVHDLIPEHFGLKGAQYAGIAERRDVLVAADAIVSVSQFTKCDVVRTYGVSPDKITVIHNGCESIGTDSQFLSIFQSPLSTPYLLWCGRRAGYKNFFWFLRSVAPVLWRRGWRLVCTGGQPFGRKELLLMTLLGLRRRCEVLHVAEQQMSRLYAEAVCLVMPSLMEGFGLPIVEAMANGCPVVVPHAHAFPEIAGDAAAYYSQGNGREMRRMIERCSGDRVFREALVSKGRERAQMYSWDKCAADVNRVYKKVSKKH